MVAAAVYSTEVAFTPLAAGGLATRIFAATPAARLALLRALWPSAVGPEVARRSELVGLEKGVLRVRVPDAGWRKALFRNHRDIIVRLRRSAGELAPAKLGFLEGLVAEPSAVPDEPAAPRPWLPAGLVAAAQGIADDDVRGRFLETAARYLGRRHSWEDDDRCAKP